jgi:zinc/manganese transport system ATP-binding protein
MKGSIRLDNLTLGYDRHPAVHHLSGRFAPGSLTAIVGPNGAGKSTLLKGIKGLLKPLGGRVEMEGIEARAIAYLPQQAELDRDFPIATLDVVALGHWRRIGIFHSVTRAMREEARQALQAVGLAGFEDRPIGTLSVGQRQRALFARVLLENAPVIMLDEPFNAIDTRTAADLMALIKRWQDEARTVIAVLHDYAQVREHFPDTLLLARERLAWGPTEQVMTADNLLQARRMSEAWDEEAALCAPEGVH